MVFVGWGGVGGFVGWIDRDRNRYGERESKAERKTERKRKRVFFFEDGIGFWVFSSFETDMSGVWGRGEKDFSIYKNMQFKVPDKTPKA